MPRYSEIVTDKEMIDYLLDCTLATVEEMALRKNYPSKHAFARQCGIADKAIEYLGRSYPFTSRAKDYATEMGTYAYYTKKHETWLKYMKNTYIEGEK